MPKNNKKSAKSLEKKTKCETENKIYEIKKEFSYYKESTEKHPLYESTWKAFWQRRYLELKKEGKIDPEKYDYKNDWIKYWMQYLKDYYDNKIRFYRERMSKESSPISVSSSESSESCRKRSFSDSTDSSLPERSHKKHIESFSSISSTSFSDQDEEKSSLQSATLLNVCRMLSVLDAELGSLISNKIINLVAQIIELEKMHANSSEEILMTDENATFLETVKEKLKGLIITDLLDLKKIPVAKKCVQYIAQLIHQYPIKPKFCDVEMDETSSKLAEIITKALVTFGKTDVSPDELNVITEIYLEELNKNIELATQMDDKCETAVQSSQKAIFHENLSDDELKILIKNFTKLSDEEQHRMITFITEIEEKEPTRVRYLESCINHSNMLDNNDDDDDEDYNFDELIAKFK